MYRCLFVCRTACTGVVCRTVCTSVVCRTVCTGVKIVYRIVEQYVEQYVQVWRNGCTLPSLWTFGEPLGGTLTKNQTLDLLILTRTHVCDCAVDWVSPHPAWTFWRVEGTARCWTLWRCARCCPTPPSSSTRPATRTTASQMLKCLSRRKRKKAKPVRFSLPLCVVVTHSASILSWMRSTRKKSASKWSAVLTLSLPLRHECIIF